MDRERDKLFINLEKSTKISVFLASLEKKSERTDILGLYPHPHYASWFNLHIDTLFTCAKVLQYAVFLTLSTPWCTILMSICLLSF